MKSSRRAVRIQPDHLPRAENWRYVSEFLQGKDVCMRNQHQFDYSTRGSSTSPDVKVKGLHPLMRMLKAIGAAAAVVFMSCCLAFGQATSGSILGTVTDPSGAAVVGARVVVTSIGTGVSREASTDGRGQFIVTKLNLGTYRVSVSAKGFQTAVQSPITLQLKARVRVDFSLLVGNNETTVEVKSKPPVLQTDTPETGGQITSVDLHQLPLVSRNFLNLGTLVPGTSGSVPNDRRTAFNGAALTVSGSSSEANNIIIDGVSDNEEFTGAMSVVPPIDAIQEVKVQSSQYSAAFGSASGGVVNIAIKSGTNHFHGFADDYLQNNALNSRGFFDVGKPPIRRNEFDAGLGGPIIKNKMFFFGDYQGLREVDSSQFLGIVPTTLERQGNFSQSGYTIYNPQTTHPNPSNPAELVRDPFPQDIIPSADINPITSALINAYPTPNFKQAGIAENYLTTLRNTHNLNSYNIKVNDYVSQKDILVGRVSQQTGGLSSPGFMPNNLVGATGSQNGLNAGFSYTHIINSRTVNVARFGYNYSRYGNAIANHNNVLSQFNIPNLANNPVAAGFPLFSMHNVSYAGTVRPIATVPTPFVLTENTIQAMDNLSYIKGRNNFELGGDFFRLYDDRGQGLPGDAYLGFSGQYTSPMVGTTLPSGIADALLGLANYYETQYVFGKIDLRSTRFGAFGQDYFRATNKLTVSIGLRWDVNGPWYERLNRVEDFNLQTGHHLIPSSTRSLVNKLLGGAPLPPVFQFASTNQIYPHTNWGDFAPRLGFAYALTHSTVIRGGAGIFYGQNPANTYSNAGTDPPFFVTLGIPGTLTTPLNVSQGFPAGGVLGALQSPSLGAYYSPVHAHTPYSEKWNVDVQWSPYSTAVLDVGYAGQHSLHNMFLSWENIPTPGPGSISSRSPFPDVGPVLGYLPINDSKYNALEISFRQSMRHDLSLYSAYTYGKCNDYAYGLDGGIISDPFNIRYDWGPCSFNADSRWVSDFVYRVPHIGKFSRPARFLLNNWTTSAIITAQSGLPFTVTLGQSILNIGGRDTNRPNVTGNPNLPGNQRSLSEWFNTSAFSVPAIYTFGNESKNSLIGPGLVNIDFGLQRTFPLFESGRIVLGAQADNLFNHPNFGLPNANFSGSDFGQVRGTALGPRTIQMEMRFVF